MNPKKGMRYIVQPGCSITTRRGLVRAGGWVFENDFPEGNIEKLLAMDTPKIVKDPEDPPKVEYPEKKTESKSKEVKKTVKKAASKKGVAEKKATTKKGAKPSFAFGRK